jgi:hypothetical protein
VRRLLRSRARGWDANGKHCRISGPPRLDRIIERLAGKKCRVTNPIDKSLVGALMAIPPQQRTDEDKRKITQIFEENDKFNQCHFSVGIDWLNELHRRYEDDKPGSTPPADFQFDASDITDLLR